MDAIDLASIVVGQGAAPLVKLKLVGAGTFNLTAPTTLTDIQPITAQEGQAAYAAGGTTYPAQNQIVTLRNGLDGTVDVSSDASENSGNPKAPTITIIGAQTRR